ncbi:MAG: pyridoxal phosphate-dependent decarboxylase family protein [Pseudohongiellaceae bacterium]
MATQNTDDSSQKRAFQDLADGEVFEKARDAAGDYMAGVMGQRVYPDEQGMAGLVAFDEALPEGGGDAGEIVEQLHRVGSPGTVASLGGRYFGFVTGSALPVSLAARWLADVWDQNSAIYRVSPTSAVLEEVCERWLRELLGLPDETVAGFVSGSASATFCGLAAGRYRVLDNLGWDVNQKGMNGAPPVRVVTSKDIHATVVKAVALLGFGIDNLELVETDEQERIVEAAVPELDSSTILILQAGNVNSGSFDAFDGLCDKARSVGAWVHIDGAFGLWAAAVPEFAHLCKGMNKANSWSVDGHKTLNTPYDSGVVLCRDREALVKAMQAIGSYIAYSKNRDGMLYTPEMSRRARVVEFWAALKFLGRAGIVELVSNFHLRAKQFADELQAEGFTIVNDVVFNQVLVGFENITIRNHIIEHIEASGECWVGGATFCGHSVIRISVCSWATTADDVSRSVKAFVAARASL